MRSDGQWWLIVNKKEEITRAKATLKEAYELMIELIPRLDKPIVLDQTIEKNGFTVRIILDH